MMRANASGTPTAYVRTRTRTAAPASAGDETDRHADDAANGEVTIRCEHAKIDVREARERRLVDDEGGQCDRQDDRREENGRVVEPIAALAFVCEKLQRSECGERECEPDTVENERSLRRVLRTHGQHDCKRGGERCDRARNEDRASTESLRHGRPDHGAERRGAQR